MYREYKISTGRYTGSYRVYLHKDYWRKDYPDIPLKEWTVDTEYETGDWVLSMDGFVCQVLNVNPLVNKVNHTTLFVRFPMCTVTYYTKNDGTKKFANFYAMFTSREKDNVSGGRITLDSGKKIKFATLVSQGMNVFEAYKKAIKDIAITIRMKRHIYALFQDKLVRNTLMTELKPFVDKLNSRITEDQIIEHLELLLMKSRQGSQNHRENIKFIMELKGMITPQSNKRTIEDANYQEIIPPQLPV